MTNILSKNHWLIKYKLYHLPFWAIYHYLWWSLYSEDALEAANNILKAPFTVKYLFYVIFQAVGVYFCLYFLIPKYLQKAKYVQFLSLLVVTILVISTVIMSGYYIGASLTTASFSSLFKMESNPINIVKFNSFPSTLASMTLGMSIKLGKDWVTSQQHRQALEKEKLATELKFLKSQYNPHFLFNTINSIFVLINKNTELATESLAKFSGLLRYQLYECNESQIPLNRELLYLESFVELERLRQNENFEIKTNLLPNYHGNFSIAPFILMPFIENAFKHVSQKEDHINWIKIDLSIEGDLLNFTIRNSTSSELVSRDLVNFGGLGLKNVQRRLDLIYPDKYELETTNADGIYTAHLHLSLSTLSPEHLLPTETDKSL